jgi:CRISPR/Cas system-associated exonuclease Cas4 (RecB family)
MKPRGIPKPPEPPKTEHPRPSVAEREPAQELRFAGRVSATDLRRLVECPLACWYASQAPFETAAPTLGLAIGQVVHTSRAELSQASWQRYVDAKSHADLWSPEIESNNRALIADVFDRHVFLDAFGQKAAAARLKFTSLLLAMERQRASRASELLARGFKGEALALRVLPFEVEVPIYDSLRAFAGVCDEVWSDGEFLVPVELKTSPPTKEHRFANRAQAAAYGFLFTEASGLKVRECRVHYLTQGIIDSFQFDGTWKRRIPRLIEGVRSNRAAPNPPKGRPSPAVCGYCAFQAVCPESKAPTLSESMDSLFQSEVVA